MIVNKIENTFVSFGQTRRLSRMSSIHSIEVIEITNQINFVNYLEIEIPDPVNTVI